VGRGKKGCLRGALALKYYREFKRGEAPLLKKPSPSPLRERGIKGVRVIKNL